MRGIYRVLLVLHTLVGVGAIAGGLAAILNPRDPLGVSAEYLRNSPFDDYLIPGIILFTVIGVGNVISALAIWSEWKIRGYMSSVFGWALVIWIVVQCIMLSSVDFLHVLFFAIGVVEVVLAVVVAFEQRLFPTNLLLDLHRKIRKAI